jgi:hypothetical protein
MTQSPYKIVSLAEAFPNYHGGPEDFLHDHGNFVSKPEEVFVIVVEAHFISDIEGAFTHEDIFGTLPFPNESAVCAALLFKKDLTIPNACYLDYDLDYAPSLIVEGNVTARALNLGGGQTHIKGDCTVTEVLYGHYNHGSLIVDGTTTAPLIIASDYSMSFNGRVEANYVMSNGSAFKMNGPAFKIEALGLKFKMKLPTFKKRHLDTDANRSEIAAIIDPHFLTHHGFNDENINIALIKGDSLLKNKPIGAKNRRREDYLSQATLDKLAELAARETSGLTITEIDFTGCSLDEIPQEVQKYTHVERLTVRNNGIEYLPEWFSSLNALRELDLSNNSGLSALRLGSAQMKTLERLDLGNTCISSSNDSEMPLPMLRELVAGKPLYEENPAIGNFAITFDWSRVPSLQHLHLHYTSYYWTWDTDFGFYQLKHLKYLHHGYIVSGPMGNNLSQLQNLEFYGYETGWSSDGNHAGQLDIDTLARLPKLRVLHIEKSGRGVSQELIFLLRKRFPNLYIIAHALDATFEADLAIEKKYGLWLKTYGEYRLENDALVQVVFNEALEARLRLSPKLFEEIMTYALGHARDAIYQVEDRSAREPRFKVLIDMVNRVKDFVPQCASWTHLLDRRTYRLWECVYASVIWYALRRADHTFVHLEEALAQLAICLPIEKNTGRNEFIDLYEIAQELKIPS